jgi:hypothetical protein
VMQDTGSVKSSSSWHGRYLAHPSFGINLFFYQRPLFPFSLHCRARFLAKW